MREMIVVTFADKIPILKDPAVEGTEQMIEALQEQHPDGIVSVLTVEEGLVTHVEHSKTYMYYKEMSRILEDEE